MKEIWQKKPLKDLCQIKPPKNEAKKKLNADDFVSFVPMMNLGISQKDLVLDTDKYLSEVSGSYTYFSDNDVLLAKITPCFENGKLGIANNLTNSIGFGSSEFVVLRASAELDPEYLYYFLSQESFREDGTKVMTGAVGHKRVPKEFIENYLVPFPSLKEQARIVAVLDEIFSGLDKTIANIEKNLENSRELFDSYLNQIFSENNEDWLQEKLGTVVDFQGGSQPPKSEFKYEYSKNLVRLIQIRDYKSDKHIVYIPKNKARRFCSSEDIMIGRYGPPLFQILRGIEGSYNVALIKALPDETRVSNNYLFYFLKNRDIFNYIERSSSRTAGQTGFNKKILEEYPIKFPKSLDDQKLVVEKIENTENKSKQLGANYLRMKVSIDQLKSSILRKAFSGELAKKSDKILNELGA